AGHGPAADTDGNVYCTTGNAIENATFNEKICISNSVIKLNKNCRVLDFFAAAGQDFLNQKDMDLGSGGVLVVPDQTVAPKKLLVTGGKQGWIYLLDRDKLGHLEPGDGQDSNGTLAHGQKMALYDFLSLHKAQG